MLRQSPSTVRVVLLKALPQATLARGFSQLVCYRFFRLVWSELTVVQSAIRYAILATRADVFFPTARY